MPRVRRTTGRSTTISRQKRKQQAVKGLKKTKQFGQKLGQKIKKRGQKIKEESKFKFLLFLSKLSKLKSEKFLLPRVVTPILQENRVILFGGLAEPVTRGQISEPYDAGKVQGPVLYGVGTGPENAQKENTDYSTYVDTLDVGREYSDYKLSRCWATGIALTFGQGKSLYNPDKPEEWDWDKAGGGTNHEMEHAIKCITQCMLNFLSQSKSSDISMHTILYDFFMGVLRGNNKGERSKNISQKITMLLRKQQVIAGLPSCSVFNQFKCGLDLIKIELKQIPGQGWFYVEVQPDEIEILRVVEKMKGGKSQSGKMEEGKYNEKGGCNFYGMDMEDDINKKDGKLRPRSAWKSKERLDRCYKQKGSKGQTSVNDIVGEESMYAQELNYAWSLKEMSNEELKTLIVSRTQIVCNKYNEIMKLDKMLSGVVIASSLMMLSVSMGRVLDSNKDLKTSYDPQLYKLGAKAVSFLTKLANENSDKSLEYFLNLYSKSGDYANFKEMTTNPYTSNYLEKAETTENLFYQKGGMDPDETIVEDMPLEIRGSKRKNDGFSTPNTKRHQRDMYSYIREDELGDEDLKLLLTTDNTPKEEFMEAKKLFIDVENTLNYRYSEAGTTHLLLRIINGYDEDNVIYYDEALKEEEKENPFLFTNISKDEITVEGIDLYYEGEDFLRELGLESEFMKYMEESESELDEQAALNRTFTSGTAAAMDALAASVPENKMDQSTLNRTFTSGTAAAMDALAASVPESEMEESETLPFDYDSQMTDSDDFSESKQEVEFEDENEDMKLENPLGFGGGKKKSKKTKRKNTKKSKNRKKKTKRKSMNNKKNTKRKNTRSSNKKNTK